MCSILESKCTDADSNYNAIMSGCIVILCIRACAVLAVIATGVCATIGVAWLLLCDINEEIML